MLSDFVLALSSSLVSAYTSIDPYDGVEKLYNELVSRLSNQIRSNPGLRNNVSLVEVRGKIFIKINGAPYLPYSVIS